MLDSVDRELIRLKVMKAVKELVMSFDPTKVGKLDQVEVVESRRRSARSGCASQGKRIDINLLLCDDEEQYEQTFAHEMAHIVCQLIWPMRNIGHGEEWKLMMRKIGYPAERCHAIDMAERMPDRWTKIDCECGREVQLGPIQSKKLRRIPGYYRCKCGRLLKL